MRKDLQAHSLWLSFEKTILVVSRFFEFSHSLGHSRPMHSAPAPTNVRCYSHSDMIVRRSEVTLRAQAV